ncbi:MAG: ribokinase [Promethearchaeia archaeon]
MTQKNYVLIIGSSNMDLNIYSERFPKPGETVTGGTFKQFLGGKGANQAVAAARSGADTVFIGKIGQDKFGDQMMDQLQSEEINIDHIIRDPEEASGVAFILINNKGENMISVAPGANAKLSPEDLNDQKDIIKNASAIVTQMEIPLKTIERIYEFAAEGDTIKILNPAPLKPIPKTILQNVDVIIPNEGELYRLYKLLGLGDISESSKEAMIKASKDISTLGVQTIITTLGKRGSLHFDARKEIAKIFPAIKVQAKDTVGAGDCFNGVLASMLTQGKSFPEAIKHATAAAAVAVTREGAQNSMPTLNEIKEMVKNFNF